MSKTLSAQMRQSIQELKDNTIKQAMESEQIYLKLINDTHNKNLVNINKKTQELGKYFDLIHPSIKENFDNSYEIYTYMMKKFNDYGIRGEKDPRVEKGYYIGNYYPNSINTYFKGLNNDSQQDVEFLISRYKNGYLKDDVNNFLEGIKKDHKDLYQKFVNDKHYSLVDGPFLRRIDVDKYKGYQYSFDDFDGCLNRVRQNFEDLTKWVDQIFDKFPIQKVEDYIKNLENLKNSTEEINKCKQELEKLRNLDNKDKLVTKIITGDSVGSLHDEYQNLRDMTQVYYSMESSIGNLYQKAKLEYPEVQKFYDFKINPIQIKLKDEVEKVKSEQPKNVSEQKDELTLWKEQNKQLQKQIEFKNNKIIDKDKEINSLILEKEKLLKTIQILTNIQQENKAKSINLKDIYEQYLPQHTEDQDNQNLKSMGEIIYQLSQSDQNLEF